MRKKTSVLKQKKKADGARKGGYVTDAREKGQREEKSKSSRVCRITLATSFPRT